MREIKYKAYIKESKAIFDVLVIDCYIKEVRCVTGGQYECPTSGQIMTDFDFPVFAMNEVVLMQYTGLKDKNGKEIYEGDILETDECILEVAWGEYEWLLNGKAKNPDHDEVDYWQEGVMHLREIDQNYGEDKDERVIGNIYENPELIKN